MGSTEEARMPVSRPLVAVARRVEAGRLDLRAEHAAAATEVHPNEKALLYGSYDYDPKSDVLRAPMRVGSSDIRVEQLTIIDLGLAAGGT